MINTFSSPPLTEAPPDSLLRSSLGCLIYLEPVRDSYQAIEDFKLVWQNQPAEASPFLGRPAQLGMLLTDWEPDTKKTGLFFHLMAVAETGIPFQIERYAGQANQSFQLAVSKYIDRVVISYVNTTEQQRPWHQPKNQAQLLDQIMTSSQDFIMLWDPIKDEQGTIVNFKPTDYNQAVLNIGLFTEQDLHQFTLLDIDPSTQQFLASYIAVINTGNPFRTEHFFQRGPFRVWFDLTVTKLGDGALSIFRDITEKKVAAYRLQRQANLLEKILNSSDNGIFVGKCIRSDTDELIDFELTRWNEPARLIIEQLSGRGVTNTTLLTLFPYSRSEGLFPFFAQVVDTGEPIKLERHYEAADKWYRISVQKLEDGIVATFVDITEARKTAQSAEINAQLIKGVLDASLNGLILLEAIRSSTGEVTDFRYLHANQTASKINGVPLDTMLSSTLLTLFPSSRTSGSFPGNVEALQTGEPVRRQLQLSCEWMDGWYDFATQRINQDMLVVSFTDITQSKHLEEDLKRSNLQLDQFASVASHDLQEPLRKIQAFSNLLIQNYTDSLSAEIIDLLNRMQLAANRMQDLVQGLLAFSRLATQQVPHQSVDLTNVLTGIYDDLEGSITAKGATVTIGKMPVLKGHLVQLQQLFQNLLSNALKYALPDVPPQITIDARPAGPEDFPLLSEQSPGSWQVITVTDNGIGFDNKHREVIFEPFSRLHGRSQYTGTGLGLAICKRVVDLHQGHISAQGTPGQGSVFTLLLPASVPTN